METRAVLLGIGASYVCMALNFATYFGLMVGTDELLMARFGFSADDVFTFYLVAAAVSSLLIAPLVCGWIVGRLWPGVEVARDEFRLVVFISSVALSIPLFFIGPLGLVFALFLCLLMGWNFRRTLARRARISHFPENLL